MARKTKAESLKTRQNILDAASKIFCKYGFNSTSLEKIASEAGVTRGAVYWHFKNKAEIYNELVSSVITSVYEIIYPVVLNQNSTIEDLKKNILKWIIRIEQEKPFRQAIEMVYIKAELTGDLDSIFKFIQKEEIKLMNQGKIFFERAKKRGEIREDINVKVASISLNALINGLFEAIVMFNDYVSLKKHGSQILDIFFKGLK